MIGIDVGGTSIKGGAIALSDARLLDRAELPTPEGGGPQAVAAAVRELSVALGHRPGTPIGICVPAVVQSGITLSAANIDASWIGLNAGALFSDTLHAPVAVLNDADAAGVAEMSALPAGQRAGVVLTITLGTGVGSALFTDGSLTPNTEPGHLTVDDNLADRHVALSALRRDQIHLADWATRVVRYLGELQMLFSPALFVIGGGGSVYFEEISTQLPPGICAIPARFGNDGGIIGAATHAATIRRFGAAGL